MSTSHPLRTALRRLDALLSREVTRLRLRYQLSLDEFRGLYVSDEQVDGLLRQSAHEDADTVADFIPSLDGGPQWSSLSRRFNLSPLAQDILLLGVAPDIDPKYVNILAYLNDDVALRWPTFDLARRLFTASPVLSAELSDALAPDGPLFGGRLMAVIEPKAERRAMPLMQFGASPYIADYLLGCAPRLPPELRFAKAQGGPALRESDALNQLLPLFRDAKRAPLVLLQGEAGSGRESAAVQFARQLGLRVLRLDVASLPAGEANGRISDAAMLARLFEAALFISANDVAPDPLLANLAHAAVPVFIAVPGDARNWKLFLKHVPLTCIRFPMPEPDARKLIWRSALTDENIEPEENAITAAADRFRLTAGSIALAAHAIRIATCSPPGTPVKAETRTVLTAARDQATLNLGTLAQPLASPMQWSDLVLPPSTMRQLRDLADAIEHRDRVFVEWGFGQSASGRGLAALLAGGSGTGKTMSAALIAKEVGLDLWRIDLSAVVSKYIGETEKHLDRIFTAATDGNTILFFDEADALFGRRSEVRDAHDRYSNIEVAYLLQRLETHDGVSILATNLVKNVDPAFSRRMHAVIEFPLPDANLREQLWCKSFAPCAPLGDDLDFAFLARQFPFSGGDIRVAALDAAFVAAAQNHPIAMQDIIQSVARQMLKQGKIPSATEFRQYYALLGALPVRANVA